jgi:hypothetical protein
MRLRSIEDSLREEYFDLLPEIRRVAWHLETQIRFHTLPILRILNSYEQLVVKSRVKECESAIRTLQRRQEGRIFDPDHPEKYSILNLPDLAGVRVLVFPHDRLVGIDKALWNCFADWTPDPVLDEGGAVLAQTYFGRCPDVSQRLLAEYQVVPMLIGYFWEVEHAALYKPDPSLRGLGESAEMKRLKTDVETALSRFEAGFEDFVRDNTRPASDIL